MFTIVELGQPLIAEFIFLGGLVSPVGFQEADKELRIIL